MQQRARGRLWIEGRAADLHEPELRQVGGEAGLRWKEALVAIIQDGPGLLKLTPGAK